MGRKFYTREYDTPPAPSREGKGYRLELLSGDSQVVSNSSISLPFGEGAGGVSYFFLFTALFLILFFQPLSSQTTAILFTPESLTIRDDSVRMEMKITIRGIQLPTERSLNLIPYLEKDGRQLMLPSLIFSGHRRSRFDKRSKLVDPHSGKEKPYIRLVGIKEKETYTIHYNISIPYANWMRHAAFCLKQTGKDCCEETLLSDTVLTRDIHLPAPYAGVEEKGGEP